MRETRSDPTALHRFSRRQFLATTAVATAGIAGCAGGDNDTTADGLDTPTQPIVENPPQAVYKPTHRESVGLLDTVQAGDYMLLPHFTTPHQFWLMRGSGEPVVTEPDAQGLHFMFAFWDSETGHQLPVDAGAEMTIRQDGKLVDRREPWPMISQSMGFHFGDNIELPTYGTYTIEVQLNEMGARKTGAFEGRFEEPVATSFEFEFDEETHQEAIQGVEFLPEEEWGERGALELMGHSDHGHGDDDDHDDDSHDHDGHDDSHDHDNHDDGHDDDEHDDHGGHGHPEMSLSPAESYPGEDLSIHTSGDAEFVIRYIENSRLASGGENYLLVSPRTPYNRIPLPDMSLSVEGDIEGEPEQTLDDELGHHYGLTADLAAGDSFELTVDTPPQVARHQGYETAFIEMDSMTVEWL